MKHNVIPLTYTTDCQNKVETGNESPVLNHHPSTYTPVNTYGPRFMNVCLSPGDSYRDHLGHYEILSPYTPPNFLPLPGRRVVDQFLTPLSDRSLFKGLPYPYRFL